MAELPEVQDPAAMLRHGLVLRQAIYSICSLYMLAILVRWAAPWLSVELHRPGLRIIPKITDPLIEAMRKLVPNLGPFDWGPFAALAAVWLIRVILVKV